MRSDPRPLSPHLQVYRWQLTSVLSILHRIDRRRADRRHDPARLVAGRRRERTGPSTSVQGFLGSWIGLLLLFGWSVALFYHLCNGLRHLWWDTGHGLDLRSVYMSGWAVLVGTAVLTVIAWVVGLSPVGP